VGSELTERTHDALVENQALHAGEGQGSARRESAYCGFRFIDDADKVFPVPAAHLREIDVENLAPGVRHGYDIARCASSSSRTSFVKDCTPL
jgi:hypothetical protein